MSDVIRVSGLTKRFGLLTAVDDLDMNIAQGEVHGFIGPNGSGKTTAIRLMCGLMQPTSGQVEVLGMQMPAQAKQVRDLLGYMTQRFSLYDDLSLAENFRFLATIRGVAAKAAADRIEELVHSFRLQGLEDKLVGPMSGGQKRRIALAAAIITKPQLLMLDEPTSEVDPNTRREMWAQFFKLSNEGATLLISTHLMDEAERCHKLTIMNDGRQVGSGAVDELKQSLDATIVQVSGDNVAVIADQISSTGSIIAVNQVGQRLRVMTNIRGRDASEQILNRLPSGYQAEEVPPSIEDVFVMATKQGSRA